MHLDLDGKGAEFEPGHCWLPNEAKEVIKICKSAKNFEGNGIKKPSLSEEAERLWRTDPRDGLRPFLEIREKYKPEFEIWFKEWCSSDQNRQFLLHSAWKNFCREKLNIKLAN